MALCMTLPRSMKSPSGDWLLRIKLAARSTTLTSIVVMLSLLAWANDLITNAVNLNKNTQLNDKLD